MARTPEYRETSVDGETGTRHLVDQITEITKRWGTPDAFQASKQTLLDLEMEVQQAMGEAGDKITALHIRRTHRDDEFVS